MYILLYDKNNNQLLFLPVICDSRPLPYTRHLNCYPIRIWPKSVFGYYAHYNNNKHS